MAWHRSAKRAERCPKRRSRNVHPTLFVQAAPAASTTAAATAPAATTTAAAAWSCQNSWTTTHTGPKGACSGCVLSNGYCSSIVKGCLDRPGQFLCRSATTTAAPGGTPGPCYCFEEQETRFSGSRGRTNRTRASLSSSLEEEPKPSLLLHYPTLLILPTPD